MSMRLKMKIEIKELTDHYDCETCGPTYADGYLVTLNGKEILSLEPYAHCYDGTNYDLSDLIIELLKKLGYDAIITRG